MSSKFKISNIINLFKLPEDEKLKKASTNPILMRELDNQLQDTKFRIQNQNIERACKILVWNNMLNMFGLYGTKAEGIRTFVKKDAHGIKIGESDYNQRYSRGKVLSIDFGTSNISREFSFTHGGIVIADYNSIVVVAPITSQKETGLDKYSPDIQNSIIPILHSEYTNIKEDSFILLHQIRAVSKNRITKIVTSLSNTELMLDIEKKLIELHSPYSKKLFEMQLENVKKEYTEELNRIISEYELKIRKLEENSK